MHNFAHILVCIRKSLLDWKFSSLGALDKAIKDTEMQLQPLLLDDMENSSSIFSHANFRIRQNKYPPQIELTKIGTTCPAYVDLEWPN